MLYLKGKRRWEARNAETARGGTGYEGLHVDERREREKGEASKTSGRPHGWQVMLVAVALVLRLWHRLPW